MKSFTLLLIKFFAVSIFLTSCLGEEDNPNAFANEELYQIMDHFYLWYEQMPNVNPSNYSNPVALLEDLKYRTYDKWSYVTTREIINSYYLEGSYIGFGFGSAFDQSGTLWITYIFKNSPLTGIGIGRGWRIVSIDGIVPTAQNINQLLGSSTEGLSRFFEFRGPNNQMISRTLTKQSITMNTVLKDSVYSINSMNVGYVAFKGFITPSIQELNTTFSKFANQNVSELIVDLRYNGGGEMKVAAHLAGLIAGQVANNQVFTRTINNNKNQNRNIADTIKLKPNSINLSRVVFITTSGTASASESLINGLKPYMDVILVGSKTHGKPVGMYSFDSIENQWVYVPICFFINNSLGQGYYFEGIPVNFSAVDDIASDFGELSEASLNAAIGALGTITPDKLVPSIRANYHPKFGIEQEIDAW